MIPSHEGSGVVTLTETGKRAVVARGWVKGTGESLFNGYKASVLQDWLPNNVSVLNAMDTSKRQRLYIFYFVDLPQFKTNTSDPV